ncbi:MAG: lipid hydroperoxide peroxidase [Campylobacteraceae bacterium 4484_4]|nr:MAG: lipid hydroperoxide peroxidase [Campylobacteraceae bacterium 4484_4]
MATTKLKGGLVNLGGREVNVGDDAPIVYVTNSEDLSDVVVGGPSDSVQLLVVVPSLDTPVCATETRQFNDKAADIEGVKTTVISMDLPFASKRFCSTEGIDNLTVASDFRNKEFANNYGVLVADGALRGVTCRAIFVVNREGKITYKEIVPEITEEPSYDSALDAAKAAR